MTLQKKSLPYFLKTWWPAVESNPLVHGPHVDAICAHLEAVVRGDIKRLVIAVPPRTGKSLIVSVLFPVWVWLHNPGARFLCASYGERLALHHSVLCRTLVRHPDFQRLWGQRVRPRSDQDEKSRFDLSSGGYRLATSVGGAVTGVGGTYLLIDDPINVADSTSMQRLRATREWYSRAFATRTDDPIGARFVQVCQRSHSEDLAAHWLSSGASACILPMEFDAKLSQVAPEAGWTDNRKDGELLCPERYSVDVLNNLKAEMGREYATQYQQSPVPSEGGLFERGWFRIIPSRPTDIVFAVRGWDVGVTSDAGDYTAGVLIGRRRSGGYVILDARRGHWGPAEVEQQIRTAASEDGKKVPVVVEQESGAAGKFAVAAIARALAGHDTRGASITGGKELRARPLAAQVESGNVQVVKGAWHESFIDELVGFPYLPFDDQVDAAAHAFNVLADRGGPAKQIMMNMG